VEAVIASGGKQCRVRESSVVRVEGLAVERGEASNSGRSFFTRRRAWSRTRSRWPAPA
jgi:ribosomal protein L21